MKAAVLEAYHRPLAIRDVDLPPPSRGEVTVEVKACGLCLTDVHISEGKIPTVSLPLIPGHEFAGVIARIGENVDGWNLGDRVTVCVDVNCGHCEFCLRGESNRCSNLKRIGFERGGGMAELVNVPATNLEKIDDAVSFEKAAVIPDAVASMYRGLKTVGGVGVGSKVAILGVGGLGIQGVKIARMLGARVTCTDLDDRKLERARAFGAEHVINPRRESFIDASRHRLGSYDVVVDNVGIRDTVFQAVQACRNGGKVVAMGYVDAALEIPSYEIVIKEKQVVGSRALTRSEFREVVALVNSGQLDPDIGELIPIRRINEALENLRNGRYLTRSVLILPFGA
jgi:2-desacetyl-2-hydroxyethyl bacteriochlorophyllide A dehydrogenase